VATHIYFILLKEHTLGEDPGLGLHVLLRLLRPIL
jgi:hypothetical protein